MSHLVSFFFSLLNVLPLRQILKGGTASPFSEEREIRENAQARACVCVCGCVYAHVYAFHNTSSHLHNTTYIYTHTYNYIYHIYCISFSLILKISDCHRSYYFSKILLCEVFCLQCILLYTKIINRSNSSFGSHLCLSLCPITILSLCWRI